MHLRILDGEFSVCKIHSIDGIDFNDEFVFAAKTDEELSLVCQSDKAPNDCIACEADWKALRIEGVLDFSLTGIISTISSALAAEKIAVFVVSTFNTDYILVKEVSLNTAIVALKAIHCEFSENV